MESEILQTAACVCDKSKIAWEYIIQNYSWVSWILSGTFGLGLGIGWLLSTLRYIVKKVEEKPTIVYLNRNQYNDSTGLPSAELPGLQQKNSSSPEVTNLLE